MASQIKNIVPLVAPQLRTKLPGNNAQMYLRDPSGNLIEVDWPDFQTLSPEVRTDMRRLADRDPQGEENLRATLFLPVGADEGQPVRA